KAFAAYAGTGWLGAALNLGPTITLVGFVLSTGAWFFQSLELASRIIITIAATGFGVAIVVLVFWWLWKNRKLLVTKQAVSEVVQTIEAVRPAMAQPGLIAQAEAVTQSPETVQLVQQAKA